MKVLDYLPYCFKDSVIVIVLATRAASLPIGYVCWRYCWHRLDCGPYSNLKTCLDDARSFNVAKRKLYSHLDAQPLFKTDIEKKTYDKTNSSNLTEFYNVFTLRSVMRPDEWPKQTKSWLTAEQAGRYSGESHNSRCWSNEIHWSCTKTLDNCSLCAEGDGATGRCKGISPRFVRTHRPSGEKATARILSVWLSSTLRHDPVAASHTLTVLSSEADATSWPSGEKPTALIESVWPSSAL
jgi:hypothetical protein